ncbi:MAG: transglutaminase-like domain-containing protein [Campylobacteraceae bacterium]
MQFFQQKLTHSILANPKYFLEIFMKRRTFLKGATIVGTAFSITPNIVFAQNKVDVFGIGESKRAFSVENSFELELNNEVAQLWIPLPFDSSYQKVAKLSYSGDFDEAFISNDNPYNTKLLYAKWNKDSKSRKLNLKFDVVTRSRVVNLTNANANQNYSDEVKEFLKGTAHTPLSPKIKELADEITKGKKAPLDKARAIYDWTIKTMHRDESVIGCGVGDATRIIEEKYFGGKCTDISSVFVALLRNAGIPAREIFGIRLGQSKISDACGKADEKGFANITGGQHCRAEFFITGAGWVAADPADVTKVKLAEKLENTDKKWKDTAEYLFGNWEMNWIGFNWARDFVLSPKPAQFPLNMLGYPYGEMGEDALNYYVPKEFKYTYTSQENKI